MSQDPFREREVEEHTNPIPSRESILERLAKRKKPTSRDELAVKPHIEGEGQLEGLHRRLHTMERDGQLAFTRCQHYTLPERLDLVKDTVINHRGGYGFLRVEGRKDDLYLSSERMKTCIHGDQALAQSLSTDRRGRREARIVHVLVPKTSQVAGHYFTEVGVGFVVPDGSRLSFDILTPPNQIMGVRMGFVVIAKLTQRSTRRTKAVGKVVEVLGDNMGTGMAVDIALHIYGILYIRPQVVEQQVAGLKEGMPEEAETDCVDLHGLPLVTIDGEDARDLDNTVYYEKKRDDDWYLWAAIVDVSYYVRPPMPSGREARNHGTSTCFPSQVVSMLPEVLSNGLCLPDPQVDHLCMVCEMTVSSKGYLTGCKFYEAMVSSHARLTYTKVWHTLRSDQDLRGQYAPLVRCLEELHSLYKVLDKTREGRDEISSEGKEAKFIFNAECRIEHIKQT